MIDSNKRGKRGNKKWFKMQGQTQLEHLLGGGVVRKVAGEGVCGARAPVVEGVARTVVAEAAVVLVVARGIAGCRGQGAAGPGGK